MFDLSELEKDLEKSQQESIERAEEGGGNRKWQGALIFPLPENCRPQWKCTEGEHAIDVIPWKVQTDLHPNNKKGTWAYTVDYFRHEKVGPLEHNVTCPLRTWGKRCPICEFRDAEMLKPSFNKEYLDRIRAKHRSMYYIWVRNVPAEEQKGVQFWAPSWHIFEQDIQGAAKIPFGGGTILFMHPSKEKGKTCYFKRTGKGPTSTKYTEHKFLDRRMDIPQEILEQASIISLETLLPQPSAEEIYEILNQAPETLESSGKTYSTASQTTEEKTTVTDQAFTQETKTKLECPHGGSFGKDCEELPANLCSKCKIWDACAEKSKEFKGTKEETKTEPVKEETKREEPTKTTEAPVVARRRRR